MPTLRDIEEARTRIRDSVNLTPCSPSAVFADLLPCKLAVKFENLQRTGSFKARGAGNKLLQLTEEERVAGVVTASAGPIVSDARKQGASRGGATSSLMRPTRQCAQTKALGYPPVCQRTNRSPCGTLFFRAQSSIPAAVLAV